MQNQQGAFSVHPQPFIVRKKCCRLRSVELPYIGLYSKSDFAHSGKLMLYHNDCSSRWACGVVPARIRAFLKNMHQCSITPTVFPFVCCNRN